MTALTVTPPSNPTTQPLSPALSGPIKCWLLDEPSDRVAIETIRRSPILKAEAASVVMDLAKAARQPATRKEIEAIIGQRFELFPQPKRDDGQWAAWWADYLDALEGLTPAAVEAGMAAWVRSPDAEFMCKPGKLRELATTVPNTNRWHRAHKRALEATHEPLPAPQPVTANDRPSREDIAEVMADFQKTMEAKDPLLKMRSKFMRPTPCARVDNTGISDEMRAHLQKRYG